MKINSIISDRCLKGPTSEHLWSNSLRFSLVGKNKGKMVTYKMCKYCGVEKPL
jgi:hypothetical protein